MTSDFVFLTCQIGMESVCKQEIAKALNGLVFAFSRPGFVTFKCTNDRSVEEFLSQPLTFARCKGISIGSEKFGDPSELANILQEKLKELETRNLHIFSRDIALPGTSNKKRVSIEGTDSTSDEKLEADSPDETLESPSSLDAPMLENYVAATSPELNKTIRQLKELLPKETQINRRPSIHSKVLNCILLDEDRVGLGWHTCNDVRSKWIGGVPAIKPKSPMVSRAYLKTLEAILWSRIPIQAGDLCAEIGCAPGGSSQALLEHKAHVLGIDPAEMDERILAHENFSHYRARNKDVRRKSYRDVKWLFTDLNLAPNYTLDCVEEIVTRRDNDIRGLVLTMKLVDQKLTSGANGLVKRVNDMGFRYVRTQQLAFNRREFCLFAIRRKALLRFGMK